MHPCRLLLPPVLAACIAVGTAHACADPGSAAAVMPPVRAVAPQVPSHPLLAWKPRAWRAPVRVNAMTQGLRVAIDPIDGTLSMPVEEGDGSSVILESERAPLQTILHADGAVQVILDDRFTEYAVARRGEDGRAVWTCAKGPTGIRQFTLQSAGAPVPMSAPAVKWEDK